MGRDIVIGIVAIFCIVLVVWLLPTSMGTVTTTPNSLPQGSLNPMYQSQFRTNDCSVDAWSRGAELPVTGRVAGYQGTVQMDPSADGVRVHVTTWLTNQPQRYRTTIQLNGDGSVVRVSPETRVTYV